MATAGRKRARGGVFGGGGEGVFCGCTSHHAERSTADFEGARLARACVPVVRCAARRASAERRPSVCALHVRVRVCRVPSELRELGNTRYQVDTDNNTSNISHRSRDENERLICQTEILT
eukprot:scaffold13029_cov113-Isochrysis_galbana.AAC.3